MVNRKKLQQIIFLSIFINCCIVILITSISVSTDYWVVARPIRQLPADLILLNKLNSLHTSLPGATLKNVSQNHDKHVVGNLTTQLSQAIDENNSDYFDSDEDDQLAILPIDLAKNDCKRYMGKIRFGLFKGMWLLNYAYGCKNRIARVSSMF